MPEAVLITGALSLAEEAAKRSSIHLSGKADYLCLGWPKYQSKFWNRDGCLEAQFAMLYGEFTPLLLEALSVWLETSE